MAVIKTENILDQLSRFYVPCSVLAFYVFST